jgi:hypothetical protein
MCDLVSAIAASKRSIIDGWMLTDTGLLKFSGGLHPFSTSRVHSFVSSANDITISDSGASIILETGIAAPTDRITVV